MLSPMMNAAFVRVLLWTYDILCCCPIIEQTTGYMSDVSESIPLSPTLRIQVVFIVECYSILTQWFDFMLKSLAAKCWYSGYVQR